MPLLRSRSEESSRPIIDPCLASARAPGKIILAGEHFVVLGAPAVAMAINLYSQVQVTPKNSSGVDVDADIPLRFLAGKNRNSGVPDPRQLLRPLQLAAEATLKQVGAKDRGLRVNVECEIPVAAGLGSSGLTNVGIILGGGRARGVELSKEKNLKLAIAAGKFLHSTPSRV